ncbi:MAG: hypothetical protein MUO42_07040 [Anaerolineaceae bacterium]|nr:hypothetical protein [Anaerolineaceae bacterium]
MKDSQGQKRYRGEDDIYQFDIQGTSIQTTALFLKGSKTFTNSIVEVEANFSEGDGSVKIVCRKGKGRDYVARLYKNGKTEIGAWYSNNPGNVFSGYSAIKKTGIYNCLRFDCMGRSLVVYENGVKIG